MAGAGMAGAGMAWQSHQKRWRGGEQRLVEGIELEYRGLGSGVTRGRGKRTREEG